MYTWLSKKLNDTVSVNNAAFFQPATSNYSRETLLNVVAFLAINNSGYNGSNHMHIA